MAEQRTRARAAWSGTGDAATERVWFETARKDRRQRVPGLLHRDRRGADRRAGDRRHGRSRRAEIGDKVAVLLNQTPFYGESGGQVGDAGRITGADGLVITVTDTQKKLGDLFVHVGEVTAGTARVGEAVRAEVDHARRGAIRAHHSATHLLHEALRENSAPMSRRRAASTRPTACASTSASRAPSRRRNSPSSRRRSTRASARTAR